jgi:hypothetical protein
LLHFRADSYFKYTCTKNRSCSTLCPNQVMLLDDSRTEMHSLAANPMIHSTGLLSSGARITPLFGKVFCMLDRKNIYSIFMACCIIYFPQIVTHFRSISCAVHIIHLSQTMHQHSNTNPMVQKFPTPRVVTPQNCENWQT